VSYTLPQHRPIVQSHIRVFITIKRQLSVTAWWKQYWAKHNLVKRSIRNKGNQTHSKTDMRQTYILLKIQKSGDQGRILSCLIQRHYSNGWWENKFRFPSMVVKILNWIVQSHDFMVMLALTIQSISITLFWWNWVELPLLIVEPYDLRSLNVCIIMLWMNLMHIKREEYLIMRDKRNR
jgi:hypothetical protein